MSLILSIETGTDICSVALSEDSEIKALRESSQGRDHAKNLGVFISEILKEYSLETEDLSAVAVGMGPGSYTGLRIGVSLAKGICYAENIPLIGISSLYSLAAAALEDYNAGITPIEDIEKATLCPMIDARRMEVYAALYNANLEEIEHVAAHIIDQTSFLKYRQDNNRLIIFGNGADKCCDILSEGVEYMNITPSARGLIKEAHRKFDEKIFEDVAYFEPFYLKDFVAKISTKNILTK